MGRGLAFRPESAYAEAEQHLPALIAKRGGDPGKALTLLRALAQLVELIGSEIYDEFEAEARERISQRDREDWPILAAPPGTWLSHLDGRRRFFRMRSSHLDVQSRRDVFTDQRLAL